MTWQALTSNLTSYDGFSLLLSRLICFWSSALGAGWLFGQFKSQRRNHRGFVGTVKSLVVHFRLKAGWSGQGIKSLRKIFFYNGDDKQWAVWHFGIINFKHFKPLKFVIADNHVKVFTPLVNPIFCFSGFYLDFCFSGVSVFYLCPVEIREEFACTAVVGGMTSHVVLWSTFSSSSNSCFTLQLLRVQ